MRPGKPATLYQYSITGFILSDKQIIMREKSVRTAESEQFESESFQEVRVRDAIPERYFIFIDSTR